MIIGNESKQYKEADHPETGAALHFFTLSSLITVRYLSGTHISVLSIWSTVESHEGLAPQPNFLKYYCVSLWHIQAGSSRHSASEMLQMHKLFL